MRIRLLLMARQDAQARQCLRAASKDTFMFSDRCHYDPRGTPGRERMVSL
jgi:hypothetical protein